MDGGQPTDVAGDVIPTGPTLTGQQSPGERIPDHLVRKALAQEVQRISQLHAVPLGERLDMIRALVDMQEEAAREDTAHGAK